MNETLSTIGEIAIVITGFAGLIVTLRPDYLSKRTLGNTRLRLLISQTLLLLFLCFLPAVFELIDPSKQWLYALSVMAVGILAINFWRVRTNSTSPMNARSSLWIMLLVLTL